MKKALLVGMLVLSAAMAASAAVAAVEAEEAPSGEIVTARGVPVCTIQNGQIVAIEIRNDVQRVPVALDERGLKLAGVKGVVEVTGAMVDGKLVVQSFNVIQPRNMPNAAPNMPMRNAE